MKTGIKIFCLFFTLFAASCKHEIPANPTTENNPENNSGKCNPDSVYFEKDVLPILISNCTMSGCHGNGSAQEGVDLTNYQSIINTADVRAGNAEESDLYEVITEDDLDKRMPQYPNPPLSDAQIATIKKWINQGAKNNSCSDCGDTTQVTFSKSVMPVISKNCTGCHNDNLQNGNVKLRNYEDVKTVALNGKLTGVITHSAGYPAMPQGGNKLPDCTINQIKIWIAAGAQNN